MWDLPSQEGYREKEFFRTVCIRGTLSHPLRWLSPLTARWSVEARMEASETLYVEHHAQAQPVRTRQGWLLACHGPCDAGQLHLLVDLGRTHERPEWDLMPAGAARVLLMLDSPRVLRLHFDLRTAASRALLLREMECSLTAASAATGYAITIRCGARPI